MRKLFAAVSGESARRGSNHSPNSGVFRSSPMSSATAAGIQLSADQVGRMFVSQYYMILEHSREMMHKLYQESSLLARPDADGEMEYTDTIDGIKEKMSSMDHFEHHVKTVDSQYSLGDGVVVLVTGELKGTDGSKRGFSQSFFLAPQDNGFFVLNDILRYVGEVDQQGLHVLEDGNCVPQTLEHDAPVEPQHEVPEPFESTKDVEDSPKEVNLATNNDISVVEKEEESEVVNVIPNPIKEENLVETSTVNVSQKMAERSFASIVKDIKTSVFAPAPVRAAPTRLTAAKTERSVNPNPTSTSVDVPALSSNVSENGNNLSNEKENDNKETEGDTHSIYVRNLPFDITPVQLEEGFNKFGPVKPGGIQIRSNKAQGFCFGFVEFEVASAVQSAIEASPVLIGGRQVRVEQKRTQAVSRERFTPNRGGGFWNDGMRGRASYGIGRGYGSRPEQYGGRTGGRGSYLN